eukprot:CAMPEP_0182615660 /NCGR_PEP_ID=MMETSP1330-20130603/35629_1 /TAXON_ID=464278 /ORGANISM="Picochlorum sp., Strain RCC944" /LENGTH=100 /DNA_ID=CAMNT_0024835623 /DNA_START=206 /DNA_END=510 /DNA_ORIENTATION=+
MKLDHTQLLPPVVNVYDGSNVARANGNADGWQASNDTTWSRTSLWHGYAANSAANSSRSPPSPLRNLETMVDHEVTGEKEECGASRVDGPRAPPISGRRQ